MTENQDAVGNRMKEILQVRGVNQAAHCDRESVI
jgi:hypothetical protein